MNFDLTQLSSVPLSSRVAPLLQGVSPSIEDYKLRPAEETKQTIKNAASSIMNQLGEELQKVAQPLSDHVFTRDNHLQIPFSESNQSASLENIPSEKFREVGKKEGVDAKEQKELEIIGSDVAGELTNWKKLGEHCEELKGRLKQLKLERNELAEKNEKIGKLVNQLGRTKASLENKLKKYESSIFSIFYKNTIKNIKTKMQVIENNHKKFQKEIKETRSTLSSLEEKIYKKKKEQSAKLLENHNSYQKLLEGIERRLEQTINQSHDQSEKLNPMLTSIEENAGNLLQNLRNVLGLVESDETLSSNSESQLLEMRDKIVENVKPLDTDINALEQVLSIEERKVEKTNQNEKIKDVKEEVIGNSPSRGIKQSQLNSIAVISQQSFSPSVKDARLAVENDLDGGAPLGSGLKQLLENGHPQLKGAHQETTLNPILSERYEVDGEFYGEEVISRESVLETNKKFSEKMLEELKAKLENPSENLSESDKAQIESDISYYEIAIKNADKVAEKKDWIHSNYFRDLIRSCENFNTAVGKYISAPVNMRFQELKNESGERIAGFYRIGVISDMRNGWVSLKELKEIEELKKNAGDSTEKREEVEGRITSINERIDKIKKKHQEKKGEMNKNQDESIDYAKSQIDVFRTNPTQIIHERRRVLQQQMIQLVIAQVGQNPEKIQEALQTGQFNMTHISLLNQQKRTLDKTGWMHDERIEIEDMAEIFAELKGKKLIFDGEGPSIDDESNIHMPVMDNVSIGTEMTLNSQFFNISVHGKGDNDEFQYAQNLKEIMAMAEAGLISLEDESVQQLLNADKLSYGEVEDFFVNLLEGNKTAVSIGCLSAKDRTGVIGARAIQRFLTKRLEDGGKKNEFEANILSKDSLASKVIQENTGTPLIKVDVYKAFEIKNVSVLKIMKLFSRHLYQLGSKKLED